jgi:hydroxypyruvate isomerase
MRFTANISILFKEYPLLERFARARAAGFSLVELWWPSGEDLARVEQAARDAGVQVTGLNFDAGDMPSGDRGLLSDPARLSVFRDNVPVALGLAQRLGCKKLNALVGLRIPSVSLEEQLELAARNVAWAADQAAGQGGVILIEALNTFENGPYLLASTKRASEFVRRVGRPNVKLQYDFYHMQRMEGNGVATVREHFAEIGHIQIADSPGRGEPGTGELYYPFIFRQLEELGYTDAIGLEYKPSGGNTEASLSWLPPAARAGDVPASTLTVY